jgi:hypothetical protein
MATYKKRPQFITSDDGIKAAEVLYSMMLDDKYMTKPSFSANSAKYPDNLIPFNDKHLAYLEDHPATNPVHYLANLKLMTRIK